VFFFYVREAVVMYFHKGDMDFNVKKLVRDAGTALSRVVQVR
jgi:protein associated with RNAse G/E